MGLFGRGNGGGMMNVIRCDEEDGVEMAPRRTRRQFNNT